MRLGWLALAFCMLVFACGSGDEVGSPDDDGAVITGAGGGVSTSSTSASSASSSSAASTSTSSSASGSGGGGSGGMAPTCPDLGVGEPNENESNAFSLEATAISDCDGDGGTVSGTIAGAGDVDWFTYDGDDGAGCVVDPTRSLTQSESGLRLCKFFECLSGETERSCPGGTTEETSPEGRSGCCGTAGFDVTDLNCTGTTDEHVHVYVRIDQPGANASTCNDYSLSYHY